MDPKSMNPEMGMKMMKKMMGNDDSSPMKMCKDMIATVKKTSEMTAFSTQELHTLFNEWLVTKKQNVLTAIEQSSSGELNDIAKRLNLTSESTAYLLARMATKGELVLQAKKANSTKKSKPNVKKKTASKKKKTTGKKKSAARKKRT